MNADPVHPGNEHATRMIDVALALSGGPVTRDYAAPLHSALRRLLPWLDDDTDCAVHPLRWVSQVDGQVLIGPRSRLLLRVAQARVEACLALAGRALALDPPLQIGQVQPRPLVAWRTLYSPLVVTGDDTEEDFLATVQRAVARWESGCQVIVGRAGNRRADTGPLVGFSVMLHGVSPAVSLRAQAEGVGGYRKLGCGVFVPHRSADAVAT